MSPKGDANRLEKLAAEQRHPMFPTHSYGSQRTDGVKKLNVPCLAGTIGSVGRIIQSRCRSIRLLSKVDARGRLTVIEGNDQVPFPIARVFYIQSQKKGTVRGNHAHRTLEEVVVCLRGAIDVEVSTGRRARVVHLDDPTVGFYIPPMVWSVQRTVTRDTLYLVLASRAYNESDYIRDLSEFRAARRRLDGR